jgi:4-amino-4-deoxy-L-arabinose transferase-like glycosyltransferase
VTRFARALLAIALVGLGVRVAYIAIAKDGPCPVRLGDTVVGSYPSDCTEGDQIFYNAEANQLAHGDGFTEPLWAVTHPGESAPPAADHPPLTVMVLAPVSWLVEHPPLSWIAGDELDANVREHRYTMAVLGTLLVGLVGLLGRRVGGDAVGLVAAGIAALSPNLWVNDGLVMSETVTGCTVVGALIVALSYRAQPSTAKAVGLGVLCGLAALARAELLLFVPLLLLPTVYAPAGADRVRRIGAGVAAAALVVGPWVAYNLTRFEEPTLISTNDGIALAGSNCDPVYSGTGIGLTAITGPDACIDNPHPPGDQSEVARVYRDRAFDYAGDHLRRVPIVVAARVARTWSLYRPLDMVSFNEGEGRERVVTRLGLAFYYPTVVAAVAGAILLWRRGQRFALWTLLVPAITVTIGVAVSYGQTRFRAAAEPSLAVLAAAALVALVRHVTNGRQATAEVR